jgi:hypothetical protein
MMVRALAAACCLCTLTAASPAVVQGVVLRYHWTKGDVVEYRVTLKTSSAVTGIPGRDAQSTEQTLTQRIRLAVDDVAADGVATMHEMVIAIRSEVLTPRGKVVFDTASPADRSADPIADTMGKMFSAVIGEPITFVLAPDGAVRKIDGGSRLIERVAGGVNADRDAAIASQALRSLYSDEALRTMLEQSFPKLPSAPIKPGDTWTGQIALGNEMIGRVTAALTFTLKSVDGDAGAQHATVSVAMKLTQDVKPPAAGGTRVALTLGDSHGEGDVRFDVARGRIERSTMRTEMPSTVSMAGPDGKPVTLSNRVTTQMSMELVQQR